MDYSKITGKQIQAARILAGLKQTQLAERSNISVPTLKRMEGSEGPAKAMANNVVAVASALEGAGICFLFASENGGVGVRLAK